jgi:hypothetical protein
MPPQQKQSTPTASVQPPVMDAPAPPAAPATLVAPTTPQSFRKTLEAGMLTISAEGVLMFKLCWSQAGKSLEDFVRHVRDKCIVDGKTLYQAALEHGFKDVLLLDPHGRITSDGHTEPEKPDLPRQLFHDPQANPLGIYGKNLLHLSMSDEFSAHARRKAAQLNTRYGR